MIYQNFIFKISFFFFVISNYIKQKMFKIICIFDSNQTYNNNVWTVTYFDHRSDRNKLNCYKLFQFTLYYYYVYTIY